MIYSSFGELKLSSLGLGCMRLPVVNGEYGNIDKDKTREMVAYALNHGVNYFDTAWGYHSGKSEEVIAELLREYPRESYYLASKFPGYDLSNIGKVKEIFPKQLERCKVEYFDFYLFHNVCEANIDEYLDPKNEILEYLLEQKRLGKIKHLGFSAHAATPTLKRILDAYGEHMEFCQIQLNWLDLKLQNAESKCKLLSERGIPIWVMEPLRGGKLASLGKEYEERLGALRPNSTAAEWAFRFLETIPGVTVVLSGMSNMEQLEENVRTFEERKPLSKEEVDTLLSVASDMTKATSLPCTACRYCTEHCPMGLDIPTLIGFYNEHSYSGSHLAPMAIKAMPEDKRPSACIGCKSCESVCPQGIEISLAMSDFSSKLNAKK